MKTSRLVRKFSCWPTLTCKAILPYSFNPLETFRHIFQISWFTISKPQTVTFFPINKFIRAYPFFKIFFRRRLFSNKVIFSIFCKKIIATINRLISDTYLRNIT